MLSQKVQLMIEIQLSTIHVHYKFSYKANINALYRASKLTHSINITCKI